MTERVHHWKHGWIPLDDYARSRGHNPSKSMAPAPNAAKGLPTRTPKGDFAGANRRADQIAQLVPGIGRPEPHKQFATQDMAEHYTGGVVFHRGQAVALADYVQKMHGGMPNAEDEAFAKGQILSNPNKGTPHSVAKRAGRKIGNILGISGLSPHYELPPGADAGSGKGSYTGGVVAYPHEADQLIKKLAQMAEGEVGLYQAHQASGILNRPNYKFRGG